jgi:uncharacterized surface protein with fasciclin (FAS1) repeats
MAESPVLYAVSASDGPAAIEVKTATGTVLNFDVAKGGELIVNMSHVLVLTVRAGNTRPVS